MRHLRRVSIARVFPASIVLSMLLCDPAAAQTSAAERESDTAHRNAAVLFDQGVKAAEKQDWKAARDHFLSAWKLEKAYQIAANLGWAELKMGDHRSAAEHLTYLFRLAPPNSLSPAERDRLQGMLGEARSRVAGVSIRVDTMGAEVLVNGEPVGLAPMPDPVFMAPGRITVEARKAGYAPAGTSLEVAAGLSSIVELSLAPESKFTPAFVPTRTPLPAGPGRTRTAIIGAGIGLTTAAVVAGAATAFVSADRAEKGQNLRSSRHCDAECLGTHDSWQNAYDSMERARADFANVSFWSFVGAGLAGAGTAVYALKTGRRGPPQQGGSSIQIGVHGTGLIVTGSW